jgi:hypothetical protein
MNTQLTLNERQMNRKGACPGGFRQTPFPGGNKIGSTPDIFQILMKQYAFWLNPTPFSAFTSVAPPDEPVINQS